MIILHIKLFFRNETLDTLALPSINDLQSGSYQCVVTSGAMSVTSDKGKVVCGLPIECMLLFAYLYDLLI